MTHGLSTSQVAAWTWVCDELGGEEPMDVDAVVAVCERGKRRDVIHADWARTVLRDLIGEKEDSNA